MHEASRDNSGDDTEWSGRAQFWVSGASDVRLRPGRQDRESLVLTGHGVRLRINHGALEVRGGFTHYPQQREEWTFFRGDPNRPSRIVLLDADGAVTLDVLAWLAEQNIPLVQLDWRGQVVTAIGTSGLGADPLLIQRQLDTAKRNKPRQSITTWLVRTKLIRSREVLRQHIPATPVREVALETMNDAIKTLKLNWLGSARSLMGLEGKAAQQYFRAWLGAPLSWKDTVRRPIPEAWKTIGWRRSHTSDNARGASHPVQAMLNYAYAVTESQLRTEVARVGLDPTIGWYHTVRSDRSTLLLDLLEPLRPSADAIVLRFVQSNTFLAGDFTIGANGVCRLHPQLARALVTGLNASSAVRGIIAELLNRLGHVRERDHSSASKAWQAQRDVLRNG